MNYTRYAALAVALIALAACGQLAQPDVETLGQEIVIADTGPWLNVPEDFMVPAQDAVGAMVAYLHLVTYGNGTLDCLPASGSVFALGVTTVTCTVTDSDDLKVEKSFLVTVTEASTPTDPGSPPQFHGVDGPYTREATSLDGWSLDLAALSITVIDDVSPADKITVECSPMLVPIGVGDFGTVVSCTATDEADNKSAAVTFRVDVTLPGASEALNDGVLAFGPPLRMSAPFSAHRLGSTVPHKIGRPMVAGEELVLDPTDLTLVLTHEAEDAVVEPTAASTTWRWDPIDQQYILNLRTRNLTAGEYGTTVSYKGIILARTTFAVSQ